MKSISKLIGLALLLLSGSFYLMTWYALVPAFIVLGLAMITRKALEPLIVGCAVGFIMLGAHGIPELADAAFPAFTDLELDAARNVAFPLNMLQGLEDTIARSLHDGGLIWVILVCILYGAFVQLLVASGGINAIADYSTKYVKNKKQSLIMTYFVSFFFFVDDYLSALSVGATMGSITRKFKVSKDKLAMVISFVCVPITIIFPISTWTIFYGTQLMGVESVAASNSNPVSAFMHTIPYNFSAMISLIIGALVVFKLLPDSKAIKEAEKLAETCEEPTEGDLDTNQKKGNILYFILPLFILLFFTMIPYPWEWGADYVFSENIDALRGIVTAIVLTYLGYLFFNVLKFGEISDNFVKGLETITFVLVVLGFTYLLKDIQGALGFDSFVEAKLNGISFLNANTLPMIVFVVVALICWATGSNWGIYAILVPSVALLSQSLDADFWLTQGALASGTVWGAAACFFSDNRVLTAQSCKIDMMKHGVSQFSYQLIILIASTIVYLLAGFIV